MIGGIIGASIGGLSASVAGGGSAMSASAFQTADASDIVVPVPDGWLDGDVLTMYVGGVEAGATPPAGWTLLQHLYKGSAGNFGTMVCWRVAAAEPASYTVVKGASNRGSAVMVVMRGLDTSVPFSAYSTEAFPFNATTAGGLILKPVVSNGRLYILGTSNWDSSTASEAWTLDGSMASVVSGNTSGGDGSGRNVVLADQALASSADVDRDWTFSHSYLLARLGLVTRPSGSATPPIRVASFSRVVDAAASGSVAVPVPSGTAPGDLLLLCVAKGVGASAAPSGWTLVNRATTTEASAVAVWSRVADGSEPATVTVTKSSATGRSVGMMLRVVGASSVANSAVSAELSNGPTSTIPAAAGVAAGDLFIAFAGSNWGDSTQDGWTNFNGMNVLPGFANTGGGANGIIMAAAWEALAAAGSTGTRAWPMWRSLNRTAVSLVVTA